MDSTTAFLFPGQGAQFVGMGQALAAELPAAATLFQRANEVLGYDLAEICFRGPAEKLNSTVHSQPGLFVCSLAALERLRQTQPELVASIGAAAGLSLGEYTALVFAGAMQFEDALRVVQCRGEAMQAASDAAKSGMVSVLGLEAEQVEATLSTRHANRTKCCRLPTTCAPAISFARVTRPPATNWLDGPKPPGR